MTTRRPEDSRHRIEEPTAEPNRSGCVDNVYAEDAHLSAVLRLHRDMIRELLQKHRRSIHGCHGCTDIVRYQPFNNSNVSTWSMRLKSTSHAPSLPTPPSSSCAATLERRDSEPTPQWRRESSIRRLYKYVDEDFSLFHSLNVDDKEPCNDRERRGVGPTPCEDYFDSFKDIKEIGDDDDGYLDPLFDEFYDCEPYREITTASSQSFVVEVDTRVDDTIEMSPETITPVPKSPEISIWDAPKPEVTKVRFGSGRTTPPGDSGGQASHVIPFCEQHTSELSQGTMNVDFTDEDRVQNAYGDVGSTIARSSKDVDSSDPSSGEDVQRQIDDILYNLFDVMDVSGSIEDVCPVATPGVEEYPHCYDNKLITSCEESGVNTDSRRSISESTSAFIRAVKFSDDAEAETTRRGVSSSTRDSAPVELYSTVLDSSSQHKLPDMESAVLREGNSSFEGEIPSPIPMKDRLNPPSAAEQREVDDILDDLFGTMDSMDACEAEALYASSTNQGDKFSGKPSSDSSSASSCSDRSFQDQEKVTKHTSISDVGTKSEVSISIEHRTIEVRNEVVEVASVPPKIDLGEKNLSPVPWKHGAPPPSPDVQKEIDALLEDFLGLMNSTNDEDIIALDTKRNIAVERSSSYRALEQETTEKVCQHASKSTGELHSSTKEVPCILDVVSTGVLDSGQFAEENEANQDVFGPSYQSPLRFPAPTSTALSPIFATQAISPSSVGIGGENSVFTSSIQSGFDKITDEAPLGRTTEKVESFHEQEAYADILAALPVLVEGGVMVESNPTIAARPVQFTPLQESRSRITSPDLNLSLNALDATLNSSEVFQVPDVSCNDDTRRPHDPVASTLSRDSAERDDDAQGQNNTSSLLGSRSKSNVVLGPPVAVAGDSSLFNRPNDSSSHSRSRGFRINEVRDSYAHVASGTSLDDPDTPAGERDTCTTGTENKNVESKIHKEMTDPERETPGESVNPADDDSLPLFLLPSLSTMSVTSSIRSRDTDDFGSVDTSELIPTDGGETPEKIPGDEGGEARDIPVEPSPPRRPGSKTIRDSPTFKTKTPVRFDPNVPFSRTSERLDRRKPPCTPSTPHLVETSRSPFRGESSGNSIGVFSSPDRSSIRSLRGFHSLASPPRTPASPIRLMPRTPRDVESARRSQGAKQGHHDHPSHVGGPAASLPSQHVRVCTNKFVFNLHPKMGPCDRCFSLASRDEQELYAARGTHLRIARTRGGCDHTCTIFPPLGDESPVRLCRQCFFATHQRDGSRLQVYRGNHVKVKLAL